MAESFFIRLPVVGPGGRHEWIYVEIDLRRYNLTTASTLYRKANSRSGMSGESYFPAHRNALPLERVSVSSLEDLLRTQMREVADFLASEDLGQEKTSGDLLTFAGTVNALMYALENHDQSESEGAIRAMAQQLGMLLVELIGQIKSHERDAEALEELASGVDASIKAAKATAFHRVYEDWALRALELCRISREYTENAVQVQSLAEEVGKAFALIEVELRQPEGIVRRTVEFLDPPEGGGFISRIMVLQSKGEMSANDLNDIADAKRHIKECEQWLLSAKDTYQFYLHRQKQICGETDEDKTPRRLAETACSELAKSQQELRFYLENYREDPGPFVQFPELISQEEYEKALSLVPPADKSSHAWYPGECREALRRYVQQIAISLIFEPRLPKELSAAMQSAKELIGQIEPKSMMRMLSQPSIRISDSNVCTSSENAVKTERSTLVSPEAVGASAALLISPEIKRSRLGELYELLMCVGYVCTYLNMHPNASKTIRGMLLVLVNIGQCSEQEAELYLSALTQRVSGKSEYVENPHRLLDRSRSSKKWWVHTQIGRAWRRRLTSAGAKFAAEFMTKFGLTQKEIEAARLRLGESLKRERFGQVQP